MPMTKNNIPYIGVYGETDEATGAAVEFTLTDDTGAVSEQQVVDAIRAVLTGATGITSVTAKRYTVAETDL